MHRRFTVLALTALLLVGSYGIAVPDAAAEQHRDANYNFWWSFPDARGDIWNIDQAIWIAQKADHTYWALTWKYVGTADGGYMGLQTDALRPDGSVGEQALFALWNANAARGDYCRPFGGEGIGYNCRLPLAFATEQVFRLRVWKLETDAGGQWWGGWISDGVTDRHIGDIRVPNDGNHRFIESANNFSEYFGEKVACDQVPQSIGQFTQPAANSRGGGTYDYSSTMVHSSKGACTGGRLTARDYGWARGYEVVLGDRLLTSSPAPSASPVPSSSPTPSPSAPPVPSSSPTSGFADVPTDYWAHDQIGRFAARGITTGCGDDDQGRRLYCPERGVTRAEMATFITRTLGQDKVAPPATPTFADVPTDYWAYGQVEAFAKLGITTGCGVNDLGQRIFCPDRGVTRAEMAAFLDRAKRQAELKPGTPTFADVPPSYWAYGWIERFFTLGVTTGCGTDDSGKTVYCPDRGVTRVEMAVFIIRAYP